MSIYFFFTRAVKNKDWKKLKKIFYYFFKLHKMNYTFKFYIIRLNTISH